MSNEITNTKTAANNNNKIAGGDLVNMINTIYTFAVYDVDLDDGIATIVPVVRLRDMALPEAPAITVDGDRWYVLAEYEISADTDRLAPTGSSIDPATFNLLQDYELDPAIPLPRASDEGAYEPDWNSRSALLWTVRRVLEG